MSKSPASGAQRVVRAASPMRISLALIAIAAAASIDARAEYISRLQVGNWGGGAWADNRTREFRNCGVTATFSGGTSLAVIVPANLAPVIMVIDSRLQVQPKQPVAVRLKFGPAAELPLAATAVEPTMIQISMPILPNAYDMVRNSAQITIVAPGLNTSLPIEGLSKALPQVIDCALRERVKLAKPPEINSPTMPFGRIEAMMSGLAIAERSGIGNYIVFEDAKRPGNMQAAAVVAGFTGAQGPGGAANILASTYFIGPDIGRDIGEAKAAIIARVRAIDPKARIADLPAIPGKPASFGIASLGNGAYEEIYLIEKPGTGFFQFTTATPAAAQKTGEAAGVKLRSAIALVVPY